MDKVSVKRVSNVYTIFQKNNLIKSVYKMTDNKLNNKSNKQSVYYRWIETV